MDSDRLLLFFKSNYLYLICSFLYFILSGFLLGGRWWSFFFCFLFYIISIFTALSPVGEWLMRVINNVRPVETREEKDYLFPLFDDAYNTAKENFPGLPKVKLFIQDTMAVNACAINTHTVAVTKGAISTFSEEELKGVLFHEFAHIYYGHTTVKTFAIVGNGFLSVFVLIARVCYWLFDMINDPYKNKNTVNAFFALVSTLGKLFFEIIIFAFTFLFNLAFAVNNRGGEYVADRFAHKNGYGEDLISALYLLQKMSLGEDSKLVTRMLASHPRISKRIMTLENALNEKE